jgi:ketosteroid isomerase-like protein
MKDFAGGLYGVIPEIVQMPLEWVQASTYGWHRMQGLGKLYNAFSRRKKWRGSLSPVGRIQYSHILRKVIMMIKYRTSVSFALAFLCIMPIVPMCVCAQEWSPAQKEVWKTVETMWESSGKGDVEGELAYCDEELSLWLQDDPLPLEKALFRKWITFYAKTEQILIQKLRPVGIKVFSEFAFVHYYVTTVSKAGTPGKAEERSLRITDIFRKQGAKWLLVGGHNSNVPQTW